MKPSEAPEEDLQRMIAEKMGISWNEYAKRAGGRIRVHPRDWPRGFARIRLQFNPDSIKPESTPPHRITNAMGDDAHNARVIEHSRAHTTADSPHYEKTPLDEAVERYGRAGFAHKFLSETGIELLGMRRYAFVLDENGRHVKVRTLFMAEIPEEIAERRRARYAKYDRGELDNLFPELKEGQRARFWLAGDGDVVRLTWHVWHWRAVLALYRSKGFGLDFVSQVRGRHWFQRKIRFYRLPK